MTFYLDLETLFWPSIVFGSLVLWYFLIRIARLVLKKMHPDNFFFIGFFLPLLIPFITLYGVVCIIYRVICGVWPTHHCVPVGVSVALVIISIATSLIIIDPFPEDWFIKQSKVYKVHEDGTHIPVETNSRGVYELTSGTYITTK